MILEYVLKYAQCGFATFPTVDKRPTRPWKDSPVAVNPQADEYKTNEFAIVLKSDDLVIDLDPRNMKGRRVWSELKDTLGLAPDDEKTMTVITGGGGIHLYYKKPPDVKIRKTLKEYPGIEFLSEGAYVLGAGSLHKRSGKLYQVQKMPFEFRPAPQKLLAFIEKVRKTNDTEIQQTNETTDHPDNIARFTEYLKTDAELAIEGQHGDITTFKVACRGRDFNVSLATCFSLMLEHYSLRCCPPWAPDALLQKVKNAYTYNDAIPGVADPRTVMPDIQISDDKKWVLLLDQHKQGAIKPSMKNICLMLENDAQLKELFAVNMFTNKLELLRKPPWHQGRINHYQLVTDRDIEHLIMYLVKRYGVEMPTDKAWKGAYVVAGYNQYHPIRDYLAELKWDGRPRLNTWLVDYCGCENSEYVCTIGAKILVAAIARVHHPGCKFDYVLVLEGKQGIGKSTVCSILGGKWYGDAPLDVNAKDTIEYVHSHWIIEFAEMISARRPDVERVKNFISRREDDYRPPYARAREKFPRQCIFIGTVNPNGCGYLTDVTGNRRFWPVECGDAIDMTCLKRDRDQLLAEAYERFKSGERLTLDSKMAIIAETEAQRRVAVDPWVDIIAQWSGGNPHINEIRAQDLYVNLLGGTYLNITPYALRRISSALQSAGWITRRDADGRYYARPLLVPCDTDGEEIT